VYLPPTYVSSNGDSKRQLGNKMAEVPENICMGILFSYIDLGDFAVV
jgi:hypothetical protein